MTRAPIGLGDVFRAIGAIAPDDRARWPGIAAALGFEMLDAARAPAPGDGEAAPPRAAAPPQVELGAAAARREASLPVLAPLDGGAPDAPAPPFLVGVAALAAEPLSAPAAMRAPPPLLAPATAPSIVRALALMPQPRGPLDLDAAVRALARRRALQHLPRRRRDAIAHDVVVLQDLGEGMDAFIEDVETFVDALRQVAGRHAVRLGGFIGRPAEALAELGLHRGTAVVVLTDLGLTRLAGPDERGSARWLELADTTRRAGARATLLVPWPAERWPADVAARVALATWDRSTGVAQVLRAVREHG